MKKIISLALCCMLLLTATTTATITTAFANTHAHIATAANRVQRGNTAHVTYASHHSVVTFDVHACSCGQEILVFTRETMHSPGSCPMCLTGQPFSIGAVFECTVDENIESHIDDIYAPIVEAVRRQLEAMDLKPPTEAEIKLHNAIVAQIAEQHPGIFD